MFNLFANERKFLRRAAFWKYLEVILLFVCQIISFIVAYGIYEESHDIITTLGSLGILTTVIIAVYTYYAIYRERNFRNHHQLIVAEEATKLQKEMLRLKVDLNLAYNKINQLEQQSSWPI